jgi:murein DD-endopeptidase MepM/ murein hydrolase activator NlpD
LRRVLLQAMVLGAVLSVLALVRAVERRPDPGAAPAPRARGVTPADGAEPNPVTLSDLELLRKRALGLPVEGMDVRQLRNNFGEARTGHEHQALDILAPRGTRVLAVDDGLVVRLFNSVGKGGLTVYQFDPSETFCYYYAHLDGYAPGLAEGARLRKGDPVGFVGTTGNAPPTTPHLHFTIFKLGFEKHWWQGTAVNPFPLWALGTALP